MQERTWIILVVILAIGLGPSLWRAFLNRREYISSVRQFREHYRLPATLSDRDVMGFCKTLNNVEFEGRGDAERILLKRIAPGEEIHQALWKAFHGAGFADIWYANPGGLFGRYKLGPRWMAGVWTGPQHDLLCVKVCSTNQEANEWLSPEGWTPAQAVELALQKRDRMSFGAQICHRCGYMGPAWSNEDWRWCGKCCEEVSKQSCWGKRHGEGGEA